MESIAVDRAPPLVNQCRDGNRQAIRSKWYRAEAEFGTVRVCRRVAYSNATHRISSSNIRL
jgi:hypothetical protein